MLYKFLKYKIMKRLGKKLKAIFMIASIVATITPSVMAQESDTAKTSSIDFTTNVDLYSRYIWRGAQIGTNASIQPTVKMICKNFTLGYWGAYQFDGALPETDLYASYTLPKGFGITVTDYFISAADGALGDYFEYDEKSTLHTIEGSLSFTGPEKFPISALLGYNFHGIDAYKGSMYGEISYPIKNVTLILGAGNEMYTGKTESDWGIVNAGIKVVKNIKITNDFTLPLTGQLMLNPYTNKLYYAIGFSF